MFVINNIMIKLPRQHGYTSNIGIGREMPPSVKVQAAGYSAACCHLVFPPNQASRCWPASAWYNVWDRPSHCPSCKAALRELLWSYIWPGVTQWHAPYFATTTPSRIDVSLRTIIPNHTHPFFRPNSQNMDIASCIGWFNRAWICVSCGWFAASPLGR